MSWNRVARDIGVLAGFLYGPAEWAQEGGASAQDLRQLPRGGPVLRPQCQRRFRCAGMFRGLFARDVWLILFMAGVVVLVFLVAVVGVGQAGIGRGTLPVGLNNS
jgi:hypothetical protein